MIKNFESQTDFLNEYEKEVLLPKVVDILQSCQGSGRAVTNRRLCVLCSNVGDEVRIRKVINHIRNHNLVPCLIATSLGYHVAASAKEVTDYEESLRGRERAIRAVRNSLHRQALTLFGEEAVSAAEAETKAKTQKQKLALKPRREQKKKKKRRSVLRLKFRNRL